MATAAKKTAAKNGSAPKRGLEVTIGNGMITINIPLQPYDSASGKSLVLASTRGNIPTACEYEGETVILGLTAYVKK